MKSRLMNKTVNLIRRISTPLVVLMFVLLASYIFILHYWGRFLSLPTFVEVKRIYLYSLAIGFFVLLPILIIANYPKAVRIVLFVLVLTFCCLCSYSSVNFPQTILASKEFENHYYYVTIEGVIDESHAVYSTYKCNTEGFHCEVIYSETSGTVDDVVLVVDEEANALHVLRNSYIRFTDGLQPHEVLESEQFGNFIYYIGVYPPYGSDSKQHAYLLYKCNSSYTSCQQLPFHYTDTGGYFRLTFDDKIQELRVYKWQYKTDDYLLIYSYGAEPKCYVKDCTVSK